MAHVLVKNLSANAFGQAVNIGNNLAMVPLYLAMWGVGLYGEWLVLIALPTYFMATADGGFVPVSGNDMTIRFAQGRREETVSTFQSAWVFTSLVSIAIVACLGLVVTIFGFRTVLGLSFMSPIQTTQVFLCFLGMSLLNFQQGIIQVALRAIGRYAEGTLAINLVNVIEALAVATLLFLGERPPAIALLMIVARVASIAVNLIILRHYAPWLHHGFAKARRTEIKRLIVPSLAFLGFPAGNASVLQGITLVLSHLLGPASVTLFVTTRTMTRFVIQVISLTSWSSWPEISRHYGAGRTDQLRLFLIHGTQLAVILGLGFATIINVFSPIIFLLWTAGRLNPDRILVAILTFAAVTTTLRAFPDTIIKATNQHIGYGAWYLITCLSTLGATYFAVSELGITGAGIAIALGEVVLLILSGSIALHVIGEGFDPIRRIVSTRPPVERLFRRRSRNWSPTK